TRNTQFRTHSLQLGSLDRPMLQAQPDLIQGPRILAEAMIDNFGRLQLQMEIGRQFDLQPARQRSLPGNELPLLTTLAIFAALYERAFDLDLGSQQMLPLIPGAIPECMEDGWVEPQLQLAPHVICESLHDVPSFSPTGAATGSRGPRAAASYCWRSLYEACCDVRYEPLPVAIRRPAAFASGPERECRR